jgi:hypothetical protein
MGGHRDEAEASPMIKKLLIVSAYVVGAGNTAHAETWRSGVELIQDWSLFFCPHRLSDRYWYFTLKGSELKGVGPEGAMFTATVAENGSFKASFTGQYTHPGTDRTDYNSNEITGNLKAKWMHLHVTNFDCWYNLVRK